MRWFAALVFALVMVTSCGSGGDTADTEEGSQQTEDEYGSAEGDAAEAADDQRDQDDDAGSDLAGEGSEESERQVITTAYAAVEVDDTYEAVAELLSRTSGHGGYVEDRSERTDTDGNPTRASLTLRLPAENLPEMLEQLEELGDVSELSESAQDVTGTVRDLDARIDALETSVDRLIEIMAEADTAEDLLQVETTLSQRQADLEALQAERSSLGDQVAMSTLQVELSTEPITDIEADGFLGGLQSGWNGLVTTANALLVVAGTALPWLLVAAVPGLGLYLVLRRRGLRHRRSDMAAEQPEPAPAEQDEGAPTDSGHSAESTSGLVRKEDPEQRPLS